MPKKVLFIDRDGTIIEEPEDYQIDAFEKLRFLPRVISSLAKIAKELDFELVMVSNQDGLGTASFPEATFWPVQDFIINTLAQESVIFKEICIDRSFEHENAATRKPGTAMLSRYIYGDYDLQQSFVIGDRLTDIQLAHNLGTGSILISDRQYPGATYTTTDWEAIYHFLKNQDRKANIERATSETQVSIKLNLDNAAGTYINTGLHFFDHMLHQIARHGNFGLYCSVQGDLQVDEHHTIEDTALALGAAFAKALGAKKSIARYGFVLPMDDCLAQVALDFGGRPWLVWEVTFQRERIGDVPTEMFIHFFKSFTDAAQCNLNIKAGGSNEHHKIEAVFKAFAKALQMACSLTGQYNIPSTKGIL
ncbi:MAG: bifunctional histidinol-phosphatase/imidazoleglycerol-phosphate dehydratase HisB [Taibaiella sp.]|nr:bifunctional histidinol-phosphatase/imidazoleglycerol-phosphate dehydratase HisB [Taibaiella sp.]